MDSHIRKWLGSVICLMVVVLASANQSFACPPPYCGDCQKWDANVPGCVDDDDQDTTGGDTGIDPDVCGYCQKCSSGSCADDDDAGNTDDVCSGTGAECESCSGGACVSDCGAEQCCDGDLDVCVSTCPGDKCCDEGMCVESCDGCRSCQDNVCEDVEIESVTGPTGDYYLNDTEGVTANLSGEPDDANTCEFTWSGDASFSDTNATPTATLDVIGGTNRVSAALNGGSAVEQDDSFRTAEITTFKAKLEPEWPKCAPAVIGKEDFDISTNPTGLDGDTELLASNTSAGDWEAELTLFGGPDPAKTAAYKIWASLYTSVICECVSRYD